MVLGITINNVLRDHITQLKRVYSMVTEQEHVEPVNPYDLEYSFPNQSSTDLVVEFKVDENIDDLPLNEVTEEFNVYDLLYNEASFEIFGRADETFDGIIRKLKDYERKLGVKIVLLNKESPRSKCATLFFLSKNNFDFDRIIFPKNYKDFWSEVDVLITDNPDILSKKPKNKKSIKIENQFNIDIKSDFSIININDYKNLRKIIKNIKN